MKIELFLFRNILHRIFSLLLQVCFNNNNEFNIQCNSKDFNVLLARLVRRRLSSIMSSHQLTTLLLYISTTFPPKFFIYYINKTYVYKIVFEKNKKSCRFIFEINAFLKLF